MNEVALVGTLAFATLLPMLIASGTCFIKFSIVFQLLRNAIGLQQVPSNLTLQGLALILSLVVMAPVATQAYDYAIERQVSPADRESMQDFLSDGIGGYRHYLARYADPELVTFFAGVAQQSNARAHAPRWAAETAADTASATDATTATDITGTAAAAAATAAPTDAAAQPIYVLLPAYALSEIKSAFKIGFYIYLPFLVVDLLVSNILLALGMMMMSPVTISLPIKLILFVAMDGWTKVVKGLISQYVELATS